jgi:hypothetical protein
MQIYTKVIFVGNELKQSIVLSMLENLLPTSITRESFGVDVYLYGSYNIWNVLKNDNRYYVGAKIVIIFSNEMTDDISYEEIIRKIEPNVVVHHLTDYNVVAVKKILSQS